LDITFVDFLVRLDAGIRQRAGELAALKLAASGAVDGFGGTAGEATLWLQFIPALRPDALEQQRCVTLDICRQNVWHVCLRMKSRNFLESAQWTGAYTLNGRPPHERVTASLHTLRIHQGSVVTGWKYVDVATLLAACRCVAAIHSFLTEAVAVTVRRPYEVLEQVRPCDITATADTFAVPTS